MVLLMGIKPQTGCEKGTYRVTITRYGEIIVPQPAERKREELLIQVMIQPLLNLNVAYRPHRIASKMNLFLLR